MNQEIRRLRALCLIMTHELRRSYMQETWTMNFNTIAPDDKRLYDVWVYPNILIGAINLEFYYKTEFKFDIYIIIYNSPIRNISNSLSTFLKDIENPNEVAEVNIEQVFNSELNKRSDVDVSYYNNILSIDFYELGNEFTHDRKSHSSSSYAMIMSQEHVIDVFSNIVNEIINMSDL